MIVKVYNKDFEYNTYYINVTKVVENHSEFVLYKRNGFYKIFHKSTYEYTIEYED